MDDFNDWFMVPSVNSLDPTNNSSTTEKVKEIYINANDEGNINESSSSKNDSSNSIQTINGEEVKNDPFCALCHHEDESVKKIAARIICSCKTLWVRGLAEKTRASDLKALCSKYGKVLSAKIVTNAKTPGTRYYGLIAMASSEEALVCIEKLNHTELHGLIITVVKTTIEPTGTIKRSDLKSMQSKAPSIKSEKSAENSEDVTAIPSQIPNLVTNPTLTSGTQFSTSQSLNESSQKFTKTDLKTEKTPEKQTVLQQTEDVSTNTELQDTSITDFSGTSNQRKLDKNTDKGFRLLGVRKVQKEDKFSFPLLLLEGEKCMAAAYISCVLFGLFMVIVQNNLPKPAEVTTLNVTALQRENFLLKMQLIYNQRKENRKLTSLSNLVSIKFEEKENVTRKYLQQLELVALYLKEINFLRKEVSSMEAKYKMLQNRFTEGSSIVEKPGEKNEELPGLSLSSEEHNNVKSKSIKPITLLTYNLLFFTLLFIIASFFRSVRRAELKKIMEEKSRPPTCRMAA